MVPQLETLSVNVNEPNVSVEVFVEFPVWDATSVLGLELLWLPRICTEPEFCPVSTIIDAEAL